jgi:hypothetical protein
VAEDFDLHSSDKGKSGHRPPRRGAIPFDSVRRGRNDVRPINPGKVESAVAGPRFRTRSLAGACPLFLLGLAMVCALYPSLKNKRTTIASLPLDQPPRSSPTSQPSSPAQALSKPSPIAEAVTTRPQSSTMPKQTPNVVSDLPGFSALHDHPMRYKATRKKAFGGCTGQLELTSVRLHFQCSNQAELNIPVNSIAKANKDGVVLASGEKYHFLIANHTKDQVEAIFILWLNRVQQSQQPSRKSSL